jgi:hypothetical protein
LRLSLKRKSPPKTSTVRRSRSQVQRRPRKRKINRGDFVRVVRDIIRHGTVYAARGLTGTVNEIFRPESTGAGETKPWYVKIQVGAGVKTLRMTSVELVRET